MDDYRLLLCVHQDLSYVDRIQPQEIDKLGEEIASAFQRIIVPESQLSQEENAFNFMLLFSIMKIDGQLSKRAENSMNSRDGALLVLYRKTVITPTNLLALFRICDINTSTTSTLRCAASFYLSLLSRMELTWSVKVPDGQTSISFAKKHIANLANILTTRSGFCENNSNGSTCSVCSVVPWGIMEQALHRAIATEQPAELLDVLDSYQWPRLWQDKDREYPCMDVFYQYSTFLPLHECASRVLHNNPDNTKAKTFLREQLGSCHDLLRNVLRHMIAGFETTDDDNSAPNRLKRVIDVCHFLNRFIHCLASLPIDRETNALVRRARTALDEAFLDCMSNCTEHDLNKLDVISLGGTTGLVNKIEDILYIMSTWKDLHDLTDQERWESFHRVVISDDDSSKAANYQRWNKTTRKELRKQSKPRANLEDGEMCANCFVLEQELFDEGSQGLLKCSRCLQIKYCSRECQCEHWKAHKKQCNAVNKTTPKS